MSQCQKELRFLLHFYTLELLLRFCLFRQKIISSNNIGRAKYQNNELVITMKLMISELKTLLVSKNDIPEVLAKYLSSHFQNIA